ncbi:MAG: divalent-cation tolerance protein CutA [Caldilineaceae bacterium]|nr:divalent-cation tolerance protein CutA [Caldilineaceae bacterium]
MTGAIQVFTTVDSEENAHAIAEALVGRQLAACVQIVGPITSIYRWQGEVETSSEWLCLIKSRADLFPALEALVTQLHPYDVPEILALPVTAASKPYLAWLTRETRARPAAQTHP